jgi:hypothetical protein
MIACLRRILSLNVAVPATSCTVASAIIAILHGARSILIVQ